MQPSFAERDISSLDKICEIAIKNGQLEILQILHNMGYSPFDTAHILAVKCDHLDILQWLVSIKHKIGNELCDGAVDNLEIMHYLATKGCPWGESTCAKAAEIGNLRVIEYLLANGCPCDESACTKAAENGHLHILQFLVANGCPWNKSACAKAAINGKMEVLYWLISNGCSEEMFRSK